MSLEPKPPSANPSVAEAQAKFQQAVAFHQQGRLAQAQAIYEDLLKTHPKQADVIHLLGVIASQTGQFQRAIELIDRAIDISPNNAAFYSNRGIALQALRQFDAALSSYDKALEIQPAHAAAHANRGMALYGLKQFDVAVASYDKAIALKPDYAEAHCNRGMTLQRLKQFDAAVASYDKAIAIQPDYAVAHSNRGTALQSLMRFDEAVASYNQAIAIKPDYAEAHLNRGRALQELGEFEAAVASYDKCIAIRPDYAKAYSDRGKALQLLKLFDAAVASYDKAIAIRQDHQEDTILTRARQFHVKQASEIESHASCAIFSQQEDFTVSEATNSAGIAIVHYPAETWILKDLAERLCLEFNKRGDKTDLINTPLAGYKIYYHFNYLGCRSVLPNTKNFTYVTHINTPAKLALVRAQAAAGVIGICMSEDTARHIRELTGVNRFVGITPPALRYREYPDMNILIASRLYDDGRKNLTALKDALDYFKGKDTVLNIMGTGWEQFIASCKDEFKEINYHPVFSVQAYQHLIDKTNLLIYSGFDEGAISVVDYLASGKRVLATAQGYHLDYSDFENLHLFSNEETLKAQAEKILQEMAKSKARHERVTDWSGYCAKHIALFNQS